MPLTDIECPRCDGALHTDDLLTCRCVTPGCGAGLTPEVYRTNGVSRGYYPADINNVKWLKFDEKFIWTIIPGDKYITLRWQDDKDIQSGDVMRCIADGYAFAEAKVLATGMVTLEDYTRLNPDGHVKYRDWEHAWESLSAYYDDIPRDPKTEVKLIMYVVTEVLIDED